MEVDPRSRLIRLMQDLVIVQPDPPRRELDLGDGLVLHVHPNYMRAPQRGTVIAVGPRVKELELHDRVLYGRTTWVAMLDLTNEIHGPIGLIFHERDILALIEGDDDPIS
jgi:hypothetical protein